MKLPAIVDQFIHKTSPPVARFLSLVLDELYVQSAVWFKGERRLPVIEKSNTQRMEEDSWEARTEASDRSLTTLDEGGSVGELHQVVLGLSSTYVTPSGDIDPKVRPQVKTICKELDLTPIGFVPLPQAIMHKLKVDEGVPPTAIFLSVSNGRVTVSLYKVGVLAGQEVIEVEDLVAKLEVTLKHFKYVEVLPSRILLYGTDAAKLEELKHTLLKHPWPTRVAFLHFPKVEVLPEAFGVEAVSLAGSGEVSTEMGEEGEEENVVRVAPEELGFAKGQDILEKVQSSKFKVQSSIAEPEEKLPRKKIILPKVVIPSISIDRVRGVLENITLPISGLPILVFVTLAVVSLGLYLWFLPHASVTVYTLPKVLEETTTLTVNPTATLADAATKTIPGKSQEKVVSGQKTIAVSGKKDVGDPAKGTVTIYNKSLSERNLPKGGQLVFGSLSFTLDDTVKVASASESIGAITFGKATAAVSAVQIGSKGNLPAGSEFSFKDLATSVAIARNDQPFTGGVSREVTVVSRVDYDALVKALTTDLVEKAKAELTSGVGGGEKLIDATIKSAVSEKTFQEELDQEAKELHGNLTVTVTGTSYNEGDIAAVFKDLVRTEFPSDYTLVSEQTTMKVTDVKVKKDGSITQAATLRGIAMPILNSQDIARVLAGKPIAKAEEYLRGLSGVSGMEVGFRWSIFKSRLPLNKNNISVSIAIQE